MTHRRRYNLRQAIARCEERLARLRVELEAMGPAPERPGPSRGVVGRRVIGPGGVVYPSLTEAGRAEGVAPTTIAQRMRARGAKWRYADLGLPE